MPSPAACARRIGLGRPLDLALTLGPLRRGARDPSVRIGPDGVWRATRTPDGLATVHYAVAGGEAVVRAWGPGAAWAVDQAPATLGCDDDVEGFRPSHSVVADLHRRLPGVRIIRTAAVTEVLVPTVFEQKVQGREARQSYTAMVRRYGERAPGPGPAAGPPLVAPPAPSVLAATPYAAFHPYGVERKRADTVRRVASVASRLDEAARLAPGEARRRLLSVPGVGPWSVAEVARVALGDADAVSVGDYHLPSLVAWALAGEPRGDDDRMLELLAPFAGHRGRVQRLLEVAGPRPPRYGPRLPFRAIAAT